jgi:hypothetical protein
MGISRKRTIAMVLSIQKGLDLADAHPEIAEEWASGETELQIGQRYLPNDKPNMARATVGRALEHLLDEDERKEIAAKHEYLGKIKGGKISGRRAEEKGYGIWSMSPEERREASQRGGRIAGELMGKKNYAAGIGIGSLTHNQLVENGKNAARKRGQVPYEASQEPTDLGEMDERAYIIELKRNTKLPWKQITERTNSFFKNSRSLESIRTVYNRSWKD